jgi:hypothetical protein
VRLTVDDGHGGQAFVEHDVAIAPGRPQGLVPAAAIVRTVAGAALAGVGVVADGGGTDERRARQGHVNVPRGVPFKLRHQGGLRDPASAARRARHAEGAIFEERSSAAAQR